MQAELIAVPAFALEYLRKGHAIHFRCRHPEAAGLRVDVMNRMRGVDPFSRLWKRRTTLTLPDRTKCELLSLPDLVQAKKTQRDKDWPILRRLVEAHYFANRDKPQRAHVEFWLRELRTRELLIEIANRFPAGVKRLLLRRPLLEFANPGDATALENALELEERVERERDRAYWKPLKAELESLRQTRRLSSD